MVRAAPSVMLSGQKTWNSRLTSEREARGVVMTYQMRVPSHQSSFRKTIDPTMFSVFTLVEDGRNTFLLSNGLKITPSLTRV